MTRVSDWYTSLGNYTFPTLFIRLHTHEIDALVQNAQTGPAVESVMARLESAIGSLPGNSFIHADACAPTDSPAFRKASGAVKNARQAWQYLTESAKVRDAFASGSTVRLGLHPYRRMDTVREFRMFFRGRDLRGMSQYNLERHFGRLSGRRDEIWQRGQELAVAIAPWLPVPDVCVDVYLTSAATLMILDMNPFGPPTSPLLYRHWDQVDWSAEPKLRLISTPVQLGGDVEVNF